MINVKDKEGKRRGSVCSKGNSENAYSSPACSSPRQHSNPGLREEAGMFPKADASKTTEFGVG
jgi:hypothetical protein